jgi:two-component system nitrogen regulation response regulator GlnG
VGNSEGKSGDAPARASLASGRHVLVVDDDRPSREGLRDALAREGHRVETAIDAWQAIAQLREGRFDIAVVDLDLPPVHGVELGGWDVAKIAHAYRPGIAVFVLSAEEDPGLQPRARAVGVAEVLAKPISLRQLTALIDAVPVPAPPAADDSRPGRR